ncbi:MAG: NlpC/P60 family protein [Jatrophihabitantaceae bacterium]
MPSTAKLISGGLTAVLGLALVPVLAVAAGVGDNASGDCAGAGTGQTIASITLTAEQMGNAATIVATTAHAHDPAGTGLPSYAAVISLAAGYQESRLINSTVQTDHDSEGLFQQRISIYTAAVATDPVKATKAFLTKLLQVQNWRNQPVTVDAQAVQRSANPTAYAQWQPLAEQLTAQLWPAAVAANPPTSTPGPVSSTSSSPPATSPPPAVCVGGGGAGTGNNVAGSPSIPPGLQLTGSAAGNAAVRFALAQLGKPYVFGASGPDTYDCSGLTMASWATAGIALPHYTVDQLAHGTPVSVNLTDAVSGDLVFIPGSDGTPGAPGHVGMIAGRTPGHLWLVQAPETGIPVETTDATQWAGQIVAVRHIA